MTSTLPSRWQEILRREAAANVGTVLAQARDQPDPRRVPRWTVPSLVVGLASASLLSVMGRTEPTGRGSVPFDRSTIISTRTAGLGASAEDLAPHPPLTALPIPTPEVPAPTSDRPERPERRHGARGSDKPRAACPDCEKRRAAHLLKEPTPAPDPEPSPSVSPPPEKPLPLVINMGTRIQAVLTDPVVTGAALAGHRQARERRLRPGSPGHS